MKRKKLMDTQLNQRNQVLQQQRGHIIKPFSLQLRHLLYRPSSAMTLWLPLQLKQSTNLIPPHPSQGPLVLSTGTLLKSGLSFPCSCSPNTSSAPPMYLPLMKSLGGTAFPSKILHNSSLNSKCIETSLSQYSTRKLSRRKRMLLQPSKVFRIPRSVVV